MACVAVEFQDRDLGLFLRTSFLRIKDPDIVEAALCSEVLDDHLLGLRIFLQVHTLPNPLDILDGRHGAESPRSTVPHTQLHHPGSSVGGLVYVTRLCGGIIALLAVHCPLKVVTCSVPDPLTIPGTSFLLMECPTVPRTIGTKGSGKRLCTGRA